MPVVENTAVETETVESVETVTETAPEAVETAPETPEKTFTQEDLERLIDARLAREQKKQEQAIKKAREDERLKSMSKAERDAKMLKDLQRQVEEMQAEREMTQMTNGAREILKDNYQITVSDNLLRHLVAKTADETKSNVDEFAKLFNDAVKSAVNERMKGKTPVSPQAPASTVTAESIMAIADPIERRKMIDQNKELFMRG